MHVRMRRANTTALLNPGGIFQVEESGERCLRNRRASHERQEDEKTLVESDLITNSKEERI